MSHPLDPPAIHRSEILERQERVRAATAAAGFDALLAIGRSFYDRPGDVAWLANHQPPFPTTVFSDENRGMGHAFFLLPVSGPSTLVTDPRRWRSDLIVADDARAASDNAAAIIDVIRGVGLDRGRIAFAGFDLLPGRDRRRAAENVVRALRPGGVAVFERPQPRPPHAAVFDERASIAPETLAAALAEAGLVNAQIADDASRVRVERGAP